MQLSLAGPHGSSTTHPGWAASGGAASSSLRRVATSAWPERRRSMAISRPSWRPWETRPAGPGSPVCSAGAGPAGPASASTGRQVTGSVKLLRYWIQSQTTRSRARSTPVALSALKTGPSAAGMSTAPGPRSFVTGRMSMCMAAPGSGAGRPGEPVRDPQARDVALHVLQRPQRADRPDPGEDLAAPVQPEVADAGHPARERGDVEDELRLRELRAGRDLLAEPGRAEAGRRGERVLDRPDQPVRRRVQRAPGQ